MIAQAAPPDIREHERRQLQWLMFFRVVIASFFLGIIAITQFQKSDLFLSPFLAYVYSLVGSVYLVTFIYVFLMPFIKKIKEFAYVQIMMDIVLITALIHITGGINSMFSFMYSISIISASILLYLFGGILSATASSLVYSMLISLQHYQVIAPVEAGRFIASGYEGMPLYYPLVINISTFYLVALLGSFLAEQARRSRMQLQEKQLDIKNLEALNENILQSINSGLITLDHERRIITFNRAAEDITRCERSQVYMQSIETVFPGIDFSAATREHERKKPATIPRFETTFARHDGKDLYLGFSLSSLRDNSGREVGTIITFQDLTTLKEMEESMQRMDRLAAVGRLAAGIAHEVRNPLASISGSAQVLKKDLKLNNSNKRLMDIIVRESENLSMLITEFSQFARPAKHEKEIFTLKPLVAEVLEIFTNSPECRQILKIHQNIPDDLCIKANYKQFKQVLWNLLINAAQAIREGTGQISITAREREDGFQPVMSQKQANTNHESSLWTEIIIADTGCGINAKTLDKIFDPFFTTKERGVGLGLSIVHTIVQEHGGAVSVESEHNRGATVIVYLPH